MKSNNRNNRLVIGKISQVLRLLQSLENMELSKNDAFEVQIAKGLLMAIIEYSGYRTKYHWLFGIRLLRVPAQKNH
ncbi:hypothetical protein EZ449_12105 [Pedobacter frigidisoli]|uniref:Uncharacterized protein n=1 Tax=Pedobacter frigidisoli TaxID=2530455 RepID=A0A4R0P393_9SPHI|nr:hypothetical protein [Pedobacter frigidisoli]TCD08577.1 hypothetical protein EZ449_12105 [Pedobacter frigidisoli]